jgi:hypothetical protein
MENLLKSRTSFDYSLQNGASKRNEETLFVPLHKRELAMDIFSKGVDFHYVEIIGVSVSSIASTVPLSIRHESRDFRVVPGGVVVVGSFKCAYTQAAVQQLIDSEIEFYYIECGERLREIRRDLGHEKLSSYKFSEVGPADAYHSTIPLIFMDGMLVGGKTELDDAMREHLTEIKNFVTAQTKRCKYFAIPADREHVLKEAKNNVVRIVNVCF